MYQKRKNTKRKIIIGISIVTCFLLFILVGYMTKENRKETALELFLKDSMITIQKWIRAPFPSKKEQDQTESIVLLKGKIKAQEEELKELKKVLELSRTLTEYEIETATILSRNISYWNEVIIIDKGKDEGIEKNMAVVTESGLLGKVTKVSKKSSEVKLITACSEKYQISVTIHTDEKEVHALLTEYDDKKKKAILSIVDTSVSILPSQMVTTSGLGGVFPRGIYIGTIDKVEKDGQDSTMKAEVTLNQDFNQIRYVTVLKGASHD